MKRFKLKYASYTVTTQRWNRVSGSRVTGSAILAGSGRIGSRVSVSDPVFEPVLSFNMRVYRGVVSTAE